MDERRRPDPVSPDRDPPRAVPEQRQPYTVPRLVAHGALARRTYGPVSPDTVATDDG
jgi:hypothetical protein